jgi:type III pantothenate kinase
MILTIDIGNTQIEVGIFRDDVLKYSWRISSNTDRTEDEYMVYITHFLHSADIQFADISGVGLASVVPNKTFIFEKICEKYLKVKPVIVNHKIKLGIRILYSDPSMVGADRICNAVAAYRLYRQAVVVVDLGTATTFDVVNGKGEYLGGIISPGIETTAWALYQRAAKLPKIALDFPPQVIGRSTEHSMQSGIMLGMIKIVDGLLEDVIEELGEKPRIIATGGLARLIQPRTRYIESFHPHLVLEGLYQIYQLNATDKSH